MLTDDAEGDRDVLGGRGREPTGRDDLLLLDCKEGAFQVWGGDGVGSESVVCL